MECLFLLSAIEYTFEVVLGTPRAFCFSFLSLRTFFRRNLLVLFF